MAFNSPLALRRTPSLRPHEVSDLTAAAVSELMREGESSNTQASYRSALRYWAAWFATRYGQRIALPVPVPVVLQFVVDHAERTLQGRLKHELPASIDRALVVGGYKAKLGSLALNTICHRIAVLSKAHQIEKVLNPCETPEVKQLLAMTRRAYAKRGETIHKKDALTRDPLMAMLSTCDESIVGIRDRALLLFAWSTGGRRRSEISSANLRALKTVSQTEYSYWLGHSKTDQSGSDRPENYKPVVGAAAIALREWLKAAKIQDGLIFRRVRKGGAIGESLSPSAIRDIVIERSKLAGLEGDFSAHSLRSGFVTEATRQNVPLAEMMALTGHRTVQSVIGYTRTSNGRETVQRLLNNELPMWPL